MPTGAALVKCWPRFWSR